MSRLIRAVAAGSVVAGAWLLFQSCALTPSEKAEKDAKDSVRAQFDDYRSRVERAAAGDGSLSLSRAIAAGAFDVHGSALQDPFSGTITFYGLGQSGGGDFAAEIGAVGCVHLEVGSGEKPQWRGADCPAALKTPAGGTRPTVEVDLP